MFGGGHAAAYVCYQARRREANALDFDDVPTLAVEVFATFPEVRES